MQQLRPLNAITFNCKFIKMFNINKNIFLVLATLCLINCTSNKDQTTSTPSSSIEGTWKMIYAETVENDSLQVKELTKTEFIKIINESHFGFFNQNITNAEEYYSGSGTYTLNGDQYTETLKFTSVNSIRNHEFPFTIAIIGDTLIQSGTEVVKAAGIDRKIIEKYIRLN